MTHPSRRLVLKTLGAALASAGVQASGGSALATTPATTNGNGGTGVRMQIDQQALATVVIEQLQEWVAVGHSFTAYDVTRALRAHHVRVNIEHAAVRVVVHHRMAPLLERQVYRQQHAAFATGPALRYISA